MINIVYSKNTIHDQHKTHAVQMITITTMFICSTMSSVHNGIHTVI